jgi:hypothetical protein
MLLLNGYFEIDRRSLQVFRVLLGLLLLYDLTQRFFDLTAHYSDHGILRFDVLYKYYWPEGNWSVITPASGNSIVAIIFGISILAALSLMFGFCTRLMSIICWVGLVSIQNRNPLLYQGGDDLLRLLLFWSFFLPLGRKYNSNDTTVNNVATMAILCQVLFAFFFSGLFKGTREWWQEGSAIYYAISLDQIARPLGVWLTKHYDLSVFITRLVYVLEIGILPLFFLPYHRNSIRILVFFLILSFSLSIMCAMMVGIFPLCFIACSVLFIPTFYWDRFTPYWHTKQTFQNSENNLREYLFVFKSAVLGFVFTIILIWNIASLPGSVIAFPESLNKFVKIVRLDQSWGMFAPTVLKQDGWIVAKAELNDGTFVDVNAKDHVLSYVKPLNVLDRFKNDRWRKLNEQLYLTANNTIRGHYANLLTIEWNSKQTDLNKIIKNIDLIMMVEITQPYQMRANTRLEPVTIYRQSEPVAHQI